MRIMVNACLRSAQNRLVYLAIIALCKSTIDTDIDIDYDCNVLTQIASRLRRLSLTTWQEIKIDDSI